jgi:uronate dehydrogenase
MDTRNVLVTGAAGAVGHAVVRALRGRGHFVRGFDRAPARQDGEHRIGDLLDLERIVDACAGMDVIVHCAGVADRQDFAAELVPNNIIGTQHVLEAARLAKVASVVYASSIRVTGGLDWSEGQIGLEAGFVPGDHYGVSKAAGELLARMYAERFGISVISARLGWFVRNLDEAKLFETVPFGPRIYLSHRDAESFFARAVGMAPHAHAAVFVTSKNGGASAFDLEPARRLLGFEPQDRWPEGSSWSEDLRFDSPTFAPSLRPAR